MGDFNFDNAVENKNIRNDYDDFWMKLNSNIPGYTMPANYSKLFIYNVKIR